ncbi:chitin recognition protein [Colletotrichum incanum]|uniref:Chitin recognition protein n=1 Tax=Colletotrichum incanum TaxID=1573173 RepID=A0A161VUW6_COLIC|nr:chitin recognition protein [Colletotrichum incanum]
MRWSPVLLATLAGLEAAHAHENEPHINMVLPRLRDKEELRQRRAAFEPWNPPTVANKPRNDPTNRMTARQAAAIKLGDNVQCGGTFGRCADGYCCSSAGWCGTSEEYCRAPDCQINYGPACDGNQKPSGPDTANDARPLKGSVPYGGVGIYACEKDGDVAVTYDDGPYIYTAAMLDAFKAHSAVATWFITGNNLGKGQINVAYRDVIQRMVADGHQIASHTWSHENLDQMTLEQRKNQMVYNEIAFMDILGFYPTYMRPPYSICGAECQQQMVDLGYHITYFDLDTEGYLHTDPSQIQVSLDLWDAAMTARTPCNGSYLHIEHDIHQQVATTFTNHMLDSIVANGWKAVTVGECLGDPPENWYRGNVPGYNFKISAVSPTVCTSTRTTSSSSRTSSTSTSATSTSTALSISLDATCGAAAGKTCQGSTFGNCCSKNGWCGSTASYCGTGCQSKYGTCGSQSSSSGVSSGRTSSSSSSRRSGTSSSISRTSTFSSSIRSSTGSSSNSRSSTSSRNSISGNSNPSTTRSSSSTRSSSPSSNTRSSGTSSGTSRGSSSTSRTSTGSSSTSSTGTRSSSSAGSSTGSASRSAASSSSTLPVSSDGVCGASNGRQCFGSSSGNCCSQYGWCGSTPEHCGNGCQSAYGTCNSGSSSSSSGTPASSGGATRASSSSPAAATNTKISTNGQCGGTGGFNCLGSNFGDCCSPYNYCGNTPDHCDTGCQSNFGRCSGTGANIKVSLNGACGIPNGNTTCSGSAFGNCCSQYNFCGSSTAHCGTGCQSSFGTCCEYSIEDDADLENSNIPGPGQLLMLLRLLRQRPRLPLLRRLMPPSALFAEQQLRRRPLLRSWSRNSFLTWLGTPPWDIT